MGTRITDSGEPRENRSAHKRYPRIEVACLSQAHADIVHFEIPSGHAKAKCPECGRPVGRKVED